MHQLIGIALVLALTLAVIAAPASAAQLSRPADYGEPTTAVASVGFLSTCDIGIDDPPFLDPVPDPPPGGDPG